MDSFFTHQNLLVIFCVAVSNSAVLMLWFGRPRFLESIMQRATASATAVRCLAAGACITIWLGIFVLYDFPITGDATYFQAHGRAAMSGAIRSAYMPAFPYIMGAVDWIWSDPRSIGLFFTICFSIAGLLFRELFVLAGENSATAGKLALTGMFNGATWFLMIGYQQDEALLLLFAVLAFLLIIKNKPFAAGMILGAGLLSTKILFAITASVLCLHPPHRIKKTWGIVSVVAPAFAAQLLLLGLTPFDALDTQINQLLPPNLFAFLAITPFGFEVISGNIPVLHIASAVWLLFVLVLISRTDANLSLIAVISMMIVAWAGFFLLTPKSLSCYRLVILPVLPLVIHRLHFRYPWGIWFFAAYSTALGIQLMLYEDWISGRSPYYLFLAEHLSGWSDLIRFSVMILLDSIIIACELVWIKFGLVMLNKTSAHRGPVTVCQA